MNGKQRRGALSPLVEAEDEKIVGSIFNNDFRAHGERPLAFPGLFGKNPLDDNHRGDIHTYASTGFHFQF